MASFHVFMLLVLQMGTTVVKSRSDSKKVDEKEYITHYRYVIDHMKAENIKEYLRYLTKLPHPPASKRNAELAKGLAASWRTSGFDKVEVFPYNVYLSYPAEPGEIHLMKGDNTEKKMVIKNEPPFDDSEKAGNPIYPFNAYSPSGDVTAEFVYGNYGLESDYDTIHKLGVNVSGKIVVIRYGRGSRTKKVSRAEQRGAIGVIFYMDPSDYSILGEKYPNGSRLNEYGVQRGTINRLSGDALSLGYPSKPNYFRIKEDKYTGNPTIPTQPISSLSAYNILNFMSNDSVPLPDGFQGGVLHRYVLQSGKDKRIRLRVNTKRDSRESLTVCASLFGRTEPDRYVMFGGHRDSWVYGAADASSGTAIMMEIVRVFGYIKKTTGWRPRRSMMVCSWGAEEVGILGSTEWSDENHKFITEHVVAYLNADIMVDGGYTVNLDALEFLREGIHEVAKFVQAPDNYHNNTERKTLFEDWCAKSFASEETVDTQKPKFNTPYGGTDFKPFWHTYGTTIAHFNYGFDRSKGNANGNYHTLYDSFGWMEKFVDPKFVYHLAIGQLFAGYSMLLADAIILPFDLVAYTTQIKYNLNAFLFSYWSTLRKHKISLTFAYQRLDALIEKTKLFHKYIANVHPDKLVYETRSINDKLMNFERNFLVSGISETLSARHVVYSTISKQLKKTKFPGISEAIFFASQDPRDDWDEVRKQITLVIWCFDTANRSLDIDEWTY